MFKSKENKKPQSSLQLLPFTSCILDFNELCKQMNKGILRSILLHKGSLLHISLLHCYGLHGGKKKSMMVAGRQDRKIRVVNAFQMDLDTHLDSYDKRSRPSVASLPSLQLRSGPFKKNNLPNSPETESPSKPWLNRAESIPYADEP